MTRVIFAFLLVLTTSIFAQKRGKGFEEDLSQYRPVYETVELEDREYVEPADTIKIRNDQNAKIDSLSDVLSEIISEAGPVSGFRVQVYYGNSEREALKAQEVVRRLLGDEYKVYVSFENTFRVKVGDFVDRLRAHRIYVQLKSDFPNALLVPDKVDIQRIN